MEKTPLVSVIMSVYNGEEYLEKAIESVLSQSFADFELVVINDCSKDRTAEILAAFSERDERVRVFTNEVNLRLPASLNRAIGESRGKYIARMDADDICLPDRLEKQFAFMEANPHISLSSCRFMTLKNGKVSSGGCGGRCDNEALRAMLLVTNPILHPGVIAKAEVMRHLLYDTTRTCTEDLSLWTRMSMEGFKMEILPEYLLLYRLHDKQITATTLERQKGEVQDIQKAYFGKFLTSMDDKMSAFYIDGIYFRISASIKGYTEFVKWIRSENKKTKAFAEEDLNYALFQMLAEYKRSGIKKTDVLKGILLFPLGFLAKETKRKKEAAKRDGEACLRAAESIGLSKVGGTDEFPLLSDYIGS